LGSKQDVRSGTASARYDVGTGYCRLYNHCMDSHFDQLGGELELKKIIDTFIDRVFADRMIGFFFRKADKDRIKQMEYQLAARFLGAGIEYQGRPLAQAHARHPIMGGHFARRKQILKETLELYEVAENIKEAWLKHTEDLRPLITGQAGSGCDPIDARRRATGS
jgi:hemoglobin